MNIIGFYKSSANKEIGIVISDRTLASWNRFTKQDLHVFLVLTTIKSQEMNIYKWLVGQEEEVKIHKVILFFMEKLTTKCYEGELPEIIGNKNSIYTLSDVPLNLKIYI